jgi:hypothetical protein
MSSCYVCLTPASTLHGKIPLCDDHKPKVAPTVKVQPPAPALFVSLPPPVPQVSVIHAGQSTNTTWCGLHFRRDIDVYSWADSNCRQCKIKGGAARYIKPDDV